VVNATRYYFFAVVGFLLLGFSFVKGPIIFDNNILRCTFFGHGGLKGKKKLFLRTRVSSRLLAVLSSSFSLSLSLAFSTNLKLQFVIIYTGLLRQSNSRE
jgi:hypothetical protein